MAAERVDRLLADAARALPGDDARGEAQLLLMHVLGRDRAWLYAHADAEVDELAAARFRQLCGERARGVPVAQLVRTRGFWTLELAVDANTLIPRPDTELLVEAALARLPETADVADLGTGTGAIALAIASERPRCAVVATDVSGQALAVARANAAAHRLDNVTFVRGSWLQPLAGRRFDLIASNPPYIAEDDAHLAEGDLRFEPRLALASGIDGLDALREIVAGAPALLRPGGWLLVEHGHAQGAAVRALFEAAGFRDIATLRDLEQRERVGLGRMPPAPCT